VARKWKACISAAWLARLVAKTKIVYDALVKPVLGATVQNIDTDPVSQRHHCIAVRYGWRQNNFVSKQMLSTFSLHKILCIWRNNRPVFKQEVKQITEFERESSTVCCRHFTHIGHTAECRHLKISRWSSSGITQNISRFDATSWTPINSLVLNGQGRGRW